MNPLSLESRSCPLCGPTGQPAPFLPAKLELDALDVFAFASRKPPEYMHYQLVRCSSCDLVYADPAPASGALAEAYEEAAYDSQEEARLASHTYGRLVDKIAWRLPNRTGALDIGTGDGSFLRELDRRGFTRISGVEPSAAPIERAHPRIRALIHHGVFGPELCEPASLSLVTCFQTIEHLSDPVAVCRQAVQMLRPGGALLLVAHNRRALSARILRDRSPIYDIEHLQLFSTASARTLLRRAGLVGVTSRPIINRYPASYWARLFPLPSSAKLRVTATLGRSPLGRALIPLPAGNMAVFGFRPS
jgi:SAM-dependent methyltransferase